MLWRLLLRAVACNSLGGCRTNELTHPRLGMRFRGNCKLGLSIVCRGYFGLDLGRDRHPLGRLLVKLLVGDELGHVVNFHTVFKLILNPK